MKILEDCFESFIGAMSLEFERPEQRLKGINVCECFIVNLLEAGIIDISKLIITNDNYKDQLMRYYQKILKVHIQFIVLKIQKNVKQKYL